MTHYDVKRLALVLAVQSEIEGMKSQNILSASTGGQPIYLHSDFTNKSIELTNLAYAHDEQL